MQHYTSRVSQIPIIIPRLLNPDYWHWRVAYLSLARGASSSRLKSDSFSRQFRKHMMDERHV